MEAPLAPAHAMMAESKAAVFAVLDAHMFDAADGAYARRDLLMMVVLALANGGFISGIVRR
jgi:hypothetical protein